MAITLFASLVQDYLSAHGWLDDADRGRFVALIGDAELDEGNIYEAIIEGANHDVHNLWSTSTTIVRASMRPAPTACSSGSTRFSEAAAGASSSFATASGFRPRSTATRGLKNWFEKLSNAELSALHYQGGAAWRKRIETELRNKAAAFLKAYDDDALAALFTDLGGHCMERPDPGVRRG